MERTNEVEGMMYNDTLNFIVGDRTLSLRGTWQFERATIPIKADFTEPLNFDILASLNERNYLIFPADIPKIQALLNGAGGNDTVDFQIRVITPTGETKPVHATGTFVSFENVYQKKFTDIDQFTSTDELHLKIFKYAEQVARIGSWTWNLQSMQIYFSDHFFRLIGISPQSKALTWPSVAEYVHAEDRERYLHERVVMQQSAEPFTTDYRIIRADGAIRYFKDKIDIFVTHTGATFFVGITHDVTREVLAQQETRKQKELLGKSLDAIPQMVCVADAKGKIQFLNDQWITYTGVTHDRFQNFYLKDLTLFHPSQVKETLRAFGNSLELGLPFQTELLVRNTKGAYRWHLASVRPILDEKGQIEMWVGTFTDVHEVTLSEKKLKDSNDMLEAVFNASINGIQVFQSVYDEKRDIIDFKFRFQNKHAQEITGKEAISKSLLKEFPGVKDQLFKIYKEVIQTGVPREFEYHYSSDGLNKWVHTSIGSVDDNLIVTFQDITERKQREIQLQENKQFIETLNDASVDRIMAINHELRVLTWNKAFERDTGMKKQEALGKHLFDVFPTLRERPKFLETLHAALEGRMGSLEGEQAFMTEGTIDIYLVPLMDKAHRVYAVLCVVHDVTERVKAEMELKRLNESLKEKNFELESINEELSTFAFIASHDLREPLRKMQLFSDILVEREAIHITPHGKEIFGKMMGSINRMNSLLDEILTFSRVSSGKPKMLHFNIGQIFEIVKGDLNEVIEQKKVKIVTDPMPDFFGNPLQFSLLLSNLVNNSIKFQKPDSVPEIKISCKTVPASTVQHPRVIPDKEYLVIEILDNGIGLEEKYSQKIFQIFQRLHTATQFPGTGMGLAICKKVIENHHGFITVKSALGEGATFSCHFPILSK